MFRLTKLRLFEIGVRQTRDLRRAQLDVVEPRRSGCLDVSQRRAVADLHLLAFDGRIRRGTQSEQADDDELTWNARRDQKLTPVHGQFRGGTIAATTAEYHSPWLWT